MARDRTVYLVLGLVLALVGFGAWAVLSEPETSVQKQYSYSNGYAVFDVVKVSDTETYITLLVGDEASPYTIVLRHDPESLEDIPVEGSFHTRVYNDEEVFVTIHPDAGLTGKTTVAALEIDKVIDNKYLYNIPVSSAMTVPYGEYPVKNCADATAENTVVWLTLGSETTVYTEDYCVIVVGTDEDELIRAADRFVLTLLGIMV